MRRVATLALAFFASSLHAQTGPRYQVTDLGNFGGNPEIGTNAYGLNESTEVVGFSSTPGPAQAFVWDAGVMTNLERAGSERTSVAFDINEQGHIVGYQNNRGFVWRNGRFTLLPALPGGVSSSARAISDKGWIAGWAWERTNPGACERPTLWKKTSTGYKAIELINLHGSTECGHASAINAKGEVAGDYFRDGVWRAFTTIGGTFRTINKLESASAINDAGQIVGGAVIWRNFSIVNIDSTTSDIVAFAINNLGHVVGGYQERAALWINGQRYDLNERIDSIAPGTNCETISLRFAMDINDLGRIVANGTCYLGDGRWRIVGVLLTPIS
jgi:uncharacterized membrane protein